MKVALRPDRDRDVPPARGVPFVVLGTINSREATKALAILSEVVEARPPLRRFL
jgi:hypothetical protein